MVAPRRRARDTCLLDSRTRSIGCRTERVGWSSSAHQTLHLLARRANVTLSDDVTIRDGWGHHDACLLRDTTYVLDFVNEPDEVLEVFRTYDTTAQIARRARRRRPPRRPHRGARVRTPR